MRNDHPCKKDCPRRSGTCQATCRDLAAFNAAQAEKNEARDAERKRKNMLAEYVADAIRSMKRRKTRR